MFDIYHGKGIKCVCKKWLLSQACIGADRPHKHGSGNGLWEKHTPMGQPEDLRDFECSWRSLIRKGKRKANASLPVTDVLILNQIIPFLFLAEFIV